jgi:hypothetical protein
MFLNANKFVTSLDRAMFLNANKFVTSLEKAFFPKMETDLPIKF